MDVKTLRDQVLKLQGSFDEKAQTYQTLVAERETLLSATKTQEEAISLAKKCLESSIKQKSYIEDIVSAGLSEVFGVKYVFNLETVVAPDGTIKGLKPRLKEQDGEFDDPIASFGASSAAIVSFCMRIAILLLSSGTAKVLILDEPLANVSSSLQDRFKLFVENVCSTTGLQIIMITHMDQPFGKVYEVYKETRKGKSTSKVRLVVNEED